MANDMDVKDILSMIPDNLKDIYKKAQIVLSKVVADVEKQSARKKELESEIEALGIRLDEAKRKTKNFEVDFEIKKDAAEKELAAYVKAEKEHITSLKNEMKVQNKELQDKLAEVEHNSKRLTEAVAANEGLIETRSIMVADLEQLMKDIKERLAKYAI